MTIHHRPAMQGMALVKLDLGTHLECEAWPQTLVDEAWLRGWMTNVVLGSFLVRPSQQEPCVWRATQGLRERKTGHYFRVSSATLNE